jgi:CBS domain-containing protein
VYAALGAALGAAAVAITRAVYLVEDGFERLPFHWMWWPALGSVAVGVVGLVAPRTLGVGYSNVEHLLDGRLALGAAAALAAWKLASWTVSLGSGTSGGTLAPLLTVGGGLGAAAGGLLAAAFPAAGIDPRLAALVGMAATFAGASRAALTSIVFALEATQAPAAAVPLVAGTATAFLVSWLLMRHSIMTERIARRGVPVVGEYEADLLERVLVREVAARNVVTLRADEPLAAARMFVQSGAPGSAHQGYPVVDRTGALAGVVTRRDLLDPSADPAAPLAAAATRPALTIRAGATLREAVELMVEAEVGRLPVVDASGKLVGMLTRSDVLGAHRRRIAERRRPSPRRPGAPAPAA